MSTASQLASVRALIQSIETGAVQSVSFAGRTITKLNLDVLYERETALIDRLAKETAQGSGRANTIRYWRPA